MLSYCVTGDTITVNSSTGDSGGSALYLVSTGTTENNTSVISTYRILALTDIRDHTAVTDDVYDNGVTFCLAAWNISSSNITSCDVLGTMSVQRLINWPNVIDRRVTR